MCNFKEENQLEGKENLKVKNLTSEDGVRSFYTQGRRAALNDLLNYESSLKDHGICDFEVLESLEKYMAVEYARMGGYSKQRHQEKQ